MSYFPQAIQAWRDSTGFGRAQLVKSYFSAVAGFTEPEAVTQVDVQASLPLSCSVEAHCCRPHCSCAAPAACPSMTVMYFPPPTLWLVVCRRSQAAHSSLHWPRWDACGSGRSRTPSTG